MSAEVLNVRQAADLLGVHENTVRNWNKRGLLRGYKLPGSRYRRFPREEVERMRREMLEQYAPMTERMEDAPLVRAETADGADDLM
jgi:excisionase family DNA binding protein